MLTVVHLCLQCTYTIKTLRESQRTENKRICIFIEGKSWLFRQCLSRNKFKEITLHLCPDALE